MNTISYKDLNSVYLNEHARANAKKYFDKNQPNVFRTGFYSAPSWNWGYIIGITGVNSYNYDTKQDNPTQWFEVVTQFGQVVGASEINLPIMRPVEA